MLGEDGEVLDVGLQVRVESVQVNVCVHVDQNGTKSGHRYESLSKLSGKHAYVGKCRKNLGVLCGYISGRMREKNIANVERGLNCDLKAALSCRVQEIILDKFLKRDLPNFLQSVYGPGDNAQALRDRGCIHPAVLLDAPGSELPDDAVR